MITLAEAACGIAREVAGRRNGLAAEDRIAAEFPSRQPTKKRRARDLDVINGMVIALTFVLGRPYDMPAAECHIERWKTGDPQ